ILNAFLIFAMIGSLSWLLDSHGYDVVEGVKDIQKKVVAVEGRVLAPFPLGRSVPKLEAPSQTGASSRTVGSRCQLPPESRDAIIRVRTQRRRTIEDIAELLAVEDSKRQQFTQTVSSPTRDISPVAMEFGIEGMDVCWKIPSIDEEIRMLREIDQELER